MPLNVNHASKGSRENCVKHLKRAVQSATNEHTHTHSLEHNDRVTVAHGGQSVRDKNRCAALCKLRQGAHDLRFSARV